MERLARSTSPPEVPVSESLPLREEELLGAAAERWWELEAAERVDSVEVVLVRGSIPEAILALWAARSEKLTGRDKGNTAQVGILRHGTIGEVVEKHTQSRATEWIPCICE